jgi:hypothetical protein
MEDAGEGVFLTLPELKALFIRLKKFENMPDGGMSDDERKGLIKIEKFLYEHLSIQELEKLLER